MEKQEEEGEYFGKKKFAYAMFIRSSEKTEIIITLRVSYLYAITSYPKHTSFDLNSLFLSILFGDIRIFVLLLFRPCSKREKDQGNNNRRFTRYNRPE